MQGVAGAVAARDLRVVTRLGRPSPWGVGLILGLCAFVLYVGTCGRGVAWQDSGVHQYRILSGRLESPVGLALSHPLHYWLGRAAIRVPVGDSVFKLNLLSALCGAVAVGALGGLVVRLTRSRLAGVAAAGALAVSHSHWQMSAVTETYTLAAALMVVEWCLLLRYVRNGQPGWLVAVFAINGLHVADHLLGLLTLATYGVLLLERVLRRRLALRWVAVTLGVWVVTASPYWTLVVSHFQRTGDWAETLQSALFGGAGGTRSWAREVLNVGVPLGQVKLAVLTFGYCFPSAVVLLAIVGVFRGMRGARRVFRRILLAQTLIIVVFVGRYTIKDLYTFFVPVCAVTALWVGLGVGGLLRRWRTVRARRWIGVLVGLNVILPPIVYFAFPAIAERRGWLRERMRDIPMRNEYEHFFQPWRCTENSARALSRAALEAAGPGGLVLADSTTAPAVAVTQIVRGEPPGVRVYWTRDCLSEPERAPLSDEELQAFVMVGGRVVAIPSPDVEQLVREPLVLERGELLWRIVGR